MTEHGTGDSEGRGSLGPTERMALKILAAVTGLAVVIVAVAVLTGRQNDDPQSVVAQGVAVTEAANAEAEAEAAANGTGAGQEKVRPTPTPAPTPTPHPRADDLVFETRRHLEVLPVVDDQLAPVEFDRADYEGDGWIDEDDNCRDTRQELLYAESVTIPRMTDDDCAVKVGEWLDPWSGETLLIKDARIDRIIPLAHAHRAGAWAWSDERKQAFYLDDDPTMLNIVSVTTNEAKGFRPPENWMPPDPAAHCGYAIDWIRAKTRYVLNVTVAEKKALTDALDTCNDPDSRGPRFETLEAGPVVVVDLAP